MPTAYFLLTGDLNCNMLTDNPLSNNLRLLLHQYRLSQLIMESTRITSDSQTLIDIIATSHPRNYKRSGITPCGISDHLLDTCHPLSS